MIHFRFYQDDLFVGTRSVSGMMADLDKPLAKGRLRRHHERDSEQRGDIYAERTESKLNYARG